MGAFEVRVTDLEVDPSAVGRFEWRGAEPSPRTLGVLKHEIGR